MIIEIVAGAAVLYAAYKHYGLSKVESVVKTEVSNIEAEVGKLEAAAAAKFAAPLASLKKLL